MGAPQQWIGEEPQTLRDFRGTRFRFVVLSGDECNGRHAASG
jgi:hypothetical protein